MPSLSGVSIRQMIRKDVAAGLSLCRSAHWNQTAADWEFFLEFAPAGALVAEENGTVIGTVATVPYGPFVWISMVLVAPEFRSRGIGRLLLHRGLAMVEQGSAARLDATPAGEPLYRTLGFAPEHGVARWFLDAAAHDAPPDSDRQARTDGGAVLYGRPMAPDDWPLILQMDRHVFGASRARLLQHLALDAPAYAWVLETNRRMRAYLFGRHGHVRDQLGPLVADTRESAQVLLQSCLASHARRSFFLDAPNGDDGWRDVLGGLGFSVERTFLRMHRGALTAPGNPSMVYAVTGPEFG